MLFFPRIQCLVIAALGLNYFAVVGVNVAFDSPWRSLALTPVNLARSSQPWSLRSLWIEQRNDVPQAITVLRQQLAQFVFKFEFFLKRFAAFQGFQGLELLGDLALKGPVLGCFGHAGYAPF